MKKFLTFILVLAMVMSVTSFAMAEEGIVTTEEELRTALGNGGVITLAADIEVKAGLVINSGKEVILNLGGKTLSYKPDDKGTTALITNEGSLTIKGQGTITNKATNPDNDWSADNPNDPYPVYANNTISNKGILVVESGTIENKSEGSACYAIDGYAGSTTTIKGGTITAVKTTVRVFNWSSTKATLNVIGGEIYSGDGYGINLNMGSTPNVELNISGGTITTDDTDYNLAVYGVLSNTEGVSAADVVINVNNGTFNGAFALNGKLSTTMDAEKVSISGGDFESVICYDTPVAGFVSGGTFSVEPEAEWIVFGKVAVKNGDKWVITDAEIETKLDVKDGIAEVPAGLQDNEKFNTADEIVAAMKAVIEEKDSDTEDVAVYDVKFTVSEDGGVTWVAADKEHWPSDGKLTVTLPYPDGTGKDTHDFIVAHMFTSTAFGKTPGDIEYPAVTKTDSGIQFVVTGLSPISVGWEKAAVNNPTPSDPGTSTNPSTSSGYSGPDLWYVGGNTFGTTTTQAPTKVEIDGVAVPFTMNGSQIVVGCVDSNAHWVKASWGSTTNTVYFTPDAQAFCAQTVIPKTGDMPIWAAIAVFFGF